MNGKENKTENGKGKCEECDGMHCMHGGWCGGRHRVIRFVLLAIAFAVVFEVGVKVGEFKAMFYDGLYGAGMNGNYYMWPQGMMGGWNRTNTTVPQLQK